MAYPPTVVLALPLSSPDALAPFVEQCIVDPVVLIAVWGPDCEQIEDEIDWLIVGDATDETRFITTSTHPDESLEEAIEFAGGWVSEDGRSGTEVVRL